jgi:hypothetical protein
MQDECSTLQTCPCATAADPGQAGAALSASHTVEIGAIAVQVPLSQLASERQGGPRGSSPYSHHVPSGPQALPATGQLDGQEAA